MSFEPLDAFSAPENQASPGEALQIENQNLRAVTSKPLTPENSCISRLTILKIEKESLQGALTILGLRFSDDAVNEIYEKVQNGKDIDCTLLRNQYLGERRFTVLQERYYEVGVNKLLDSYSAVGIRTGSYYLAIEKSDDDRVRLNIDDSCFEYGKSWQRAIKLFASLKEIPLMRYLNGEVAANINGEDAIVQINDRSGVVIGSLTVGKEIEITRDLVDKQFDLYYPPLVKSMHYYLPESIYFSGISGKNFSQIVKILGDPKLELMLEKGLIRKAFNCVSEGESLDKEFLYDYPNKFEQSLEIRTTKQASIYKNSSASSRDFKRCSEKVEIEVNAFQSSDIRFEIIFSREFEEPDFIHLLNGHSSDFKPGNTTMSVSFDNENLNDGQINLIWEKIEQIALVLGLKDMRSRFARVIEKNPSHEGLEIGFNIGKMFVVLVPASFAGNGRLK